MVGILFNKSQERIRYFGPRFYLFGLWFSLREDIEIENFILNKLALGGIGLVFIVVSVLLLRSRERYFL